ncbi:MAG TPA: glycosyltransferase [Micromonosporaceae bacterium]|nr:glycosyltransferase [Micromonosporaceae bacterium]
MKVNYPGGTTFEPPSGPAPLHDPDLIVLSHLRWDWVWQRPQHLISRLASQRRTWFVEEPVRADVAQPTLRHADAGPVRRVWLEVPRDSTQIEYGAPGCAATYLDRLPGLLDDAATGSDVWVYGPTAIAIAEALQPRLLVYDMMDDLSSFADGGEAVGQMQRRALRRAALVFTGGRSLYRTACEVRGVEDTHLFPSGVETEHYAQTRDLRPIAARNERPVAGYVGVLDERLDLQLIADMAAKLHDWDIHLVGPIAKIEPSDLPVAPNLIYPGMQTYDQLPHVMAKFDVAIMPFALNDATRSISPTKTLEYLAAGLPVVSTRVPDVVADWDAVVRFADDGAEFARACTAVREDSTDERDARVAPLARRHEWDAIAAEMTALMDAALAARRADNATLAMPADAPTFLAAPPVPGAVAAASATGAPGQEVSA